MTTRYPRIFERIYGVPLMMLPEKAYTIERVFHAHTEGGALPVSLFSSEQARPAPAAERKPYPMTDTGIALIDVSGSLVQKSSFMDSLSGLTSYASIGAQFSAAMADPDVRGVMLEVDSGGGEVAGCFDLVDAMSDHDKPVWCAVNEVAASAAYAIASAADRIIMPRTALVGSIGVVALHVDQSAKDAKSGVKYTPIFAGAHKVDGHSHAPLADDVRANVQSRMDALYQIFVETVASNREMTTDAIAGTEAQVFSAADAVENGLADEIGTLSDALAAFADYLDEQDQQDADAGPIDVNQLFTAAAAAQLGVDTMSDTNPAATAASAITPEALAAAQATARTEAATAERARVSAIVGGEEAKGRTALANHFAFKTGMSAEDALAALAAAPKETASVTPVPTSATRTPFEAAMDAVGNPDVRTREVADSALTEEQEIDASAKRAAAFVKPQKAAA